MKQGRSRGATISDVAALAGVSTATVSRALHGTARVGAETRRKVDEAAQALSFSVSRSASALASGRTDRIALLNGGRLARWFVSEILQGTYTALNRENMDLLLYRAGDRDERAAFFSSVPTRRNADAMLVTSFALNPEELEVLDQVGMPVVYLNMPLDDRPSVSIDDSAAGAAVARHLIGLGHRTLAFVGGELTRFGVAWSSDDRSRGFRHAIEDSDQDVGFHQISLPDVSDSAREAVSRILNLSPTPTGIFVLHDELALPIVHILREMGMRVPEDISVVGFDDHPLAGPFDLTTVRQPVEEIGLRGGELAVHLARGLKPEKLSVEIPSTMVMRSTTGSPVSSSLLT